MSPEEASAPTQSVAGRSATPCRPLLPVRPPARGALAHCLQASSVDPATGKLRYNWSNVCMHFFTVAWLRQVRPAPQRALCAHVSPRSRHGSRIEGQRAPIGHQTRCPSMARQVCAHLSQGAAYHVARKKIPSKDGPVQVSEGAPSASLRQGRCAWPPSALATCQHARRGGSHASAGHQAGALHLRHVPHGVTHRAARGGAEPVCARQGECRLGVAGAAEPRGLFKRRAACVVPSP